jgi:hypothetical protein
MTTLEQVKVPATLKQLAPAVRLIPLTEGARKVKLMKVEVGLGAVTVTVHKLARAAALPVLSMLRVAQEKAVTEAVALGPP